MLGELRAAGIRTDFSDFNLSLKSQLRSADKSGAYLALILGDEEIKNSVYALKFLKEKKDQRNVPAAEIIPAIKAALPVK